MRRFTFAWGNARKALSVPLYLLGGAASFVVPRQANRWVVGCGTGVGEGALALALFARRDDPLLEVTWLARNTADLEAAAAYGLRAVIAGSWRGFWLTLRAQVVIVTHGFGDVNRYGSRGSFLVQLWHGIPLKLIHLDAPVTTTIPLLGRFRFVRTMFASAYQRAAQSIQLMPAASQLAAGRLRTAFGLDGDRVVVTGDPRDDVLLDGPHGQTESVARARLEHLLGTAMDDARILLYAPTWRDGEEDPAVPSPGEWICIGEYLSRTHSVLLVRPHPLGLGEYERGVAVTPGVHLLGAGLQGDITPLLPAISVLITDYSSIAFDFALTDGIILFLAPDVARYSRTRGLYEPYERFSGGTEVRTWSSLLDLLHRMDQDEQVRAALRVHVESLAERHHDFRDGRNTARVYAELLSRLEEK